MRRGRTAWLALADRIELQAALPLVFFVVGCSLAGSHTPYAAPPPSAIAPMATVAAAAPSAHGPEDRSPTESRCTDPRIPKARAAVPFRMYDLMLTPSHPNGAMVDNPFGGGRVPVSGMTEGERCAARQVLARHGAIDGGDDLYELELPDGVVLVRTPDTGAWAIYFKTFGTTVRALLYELASAGSLVIESDDYVSVATSAAVRDRFGDAAVRIVGSPAEMGALFQRGFDTWRAYDQQVGRGRL
jgi:hypothetical protein